MRKGKRRNYKRKGNNIRTTKKRARSKVKSAQKLLIVKEPIVGYNTITGKNPNEFAPEVTTVWDFPIRGNWATHRSDYRGNFAPQIARNLILNYSEENELILDPMVGSGTTLIEARLLNRNGIGYDVNKNAVEITSDRIDFKIDNKSKQSVSFGDVRTLTELKDASVDLIITHPPYANIVTYSDRKNPNDLSSLAGIPTFLDELEVGIKELFRVLKSDRYCAILIGDTRKGQHYVPLSHFVLDRCLRNGFALKEEIIKTQHNTKYGQRWKAQAKHFQFYLIMHEHLFVFRKPKPDEDFSRIRYSIFK